MKKIIYFITSFLLMASIAFADPQNPSDLLKSIANQMIAKLKSNQATLKSNPSQVYALTYKIIVPHADLAEMSKRVLPPQIWNKATASQKLKFENEFTKLLVRTYASALADYTNQTVEVYPVRGGVQGKTTVTVNSQIIRGDGPAVSVNYQLISKPSGWKVFDMSVEGVSLLESFRSQFASRLSQSNMDELIRDLAQHNAAPGS